MRLRFLSFGALIVAATVGVIAAQHSQDTRSTQGHETRTHQFPPEMCGSHQATGADSHHADMSAALGLSAEQASAIERITSEACAAMAKFHEQIQAVLTPEQRAKMQEHHGATDHGGKAHSATRPHGGK
jgi:Spy/CpxP family protein refolding chaperone